MKDLKNYIDEVKEVFDKASNILYRLQEDLGNSFQNDNVSMLNYFLPNEYKKRKTDVSDTLSHLFDYLMVTSVLKYSLENTNGIKIKFWKHRADDKSDIDFIIERTGIRTGISFNSSILIQGEKQLLKNNRINRLTIMSFENPVVRTYSDNIKLLSFKDYYKNEYSDDIAEYYYKICEEASNKCLSLAKRKLIPQLDNEYLAWFRHDVKKEYNETVVTQYYSVEKNSSKPIEEERISRSLYKTIYDRNQSDPFQRILFGDNEIFNCFITSEYLYKSFINTSHFDLTAVISGYIKCVEILLESLIKENYPGEHFISINQRKEFLYGHPNMFYKSIEVKNIDDLCMLLEIYSRECRNAHFHTDTLIEWDKVKLIRNNTIFLCRVICKMIMFSRPLSIEDYHPQDDLYNYYKSSTSKIHMFKDAPESETKRVLLIPTYLEFGAYGHIQNSNYALIEFDDNFHLTGNEYTIDFKKDYIISELSFDNIAEVIKYSEMIDKLIKNKLEKYNG